MGMAFTIPSLNRTSVGLKRAHSMPSPAVKAMPQSNQRGIETEDPHFGARVNHHASIEPAWD